MSATPTTLVGASSCTGRVHGSPLLAAVLGAGINFRVVRTWPGADRHFERKLHIRHGSRVCPEPECVSDRRRRRLQLRLPLRLGCLAL
jgi:hypothetical protein